MAEDLVQGESVTGIFLQDARDEFLCRRAECGWQVVPDFLYALVGLLQVQSLKGRVAAHQRVPGGDGHGRQFGNSSCDERRRQLKKVVVQDNFTHMTQPRDQTSDSVP